MDMTTNTGHLVQVLASQGGELRNRIELFPVGRSKTAHAKPLNVEVSNAQGLIAASLDNAPGKMLPIDFDHGLDGLGQKNGEAAGWITGMDVEGDRIVATVEWTPAGEAALREKRYRFISPVWTMTKAGQVQQILRAGLTNDPGMPQLKQVASKQSDNEETERMNPLLQKLVEALGLSTDATEDTAMASVTALVASNTAAAKIIKAANLEGDLDDGKADTIVTALAAKAEPTGDPDPEKFVPKAMFDELQTKVASLQGDIVSDKVAAAIAKAKEEGKLSPAMTDWATQLATKDMDSFTAWASKAPAILQGGELIPSLKPTQEGELTADEKAICAAAGVSEEAFLATKTGKQPEKKEA